VADDVVRFLRRLTAGSAPDPAHEAVFDDDIVGLLDAQVLQASSAWQRLGVLIETRGAHGWTNVRIEDAARPDPDRTGGGEGPPPFRSR
jgi:hypothetical protein